MQVQRLLNIWILGCILATSTLQAANFPLDKLPPYITRITEVGQRADFSLDGKKILYVTKAGGEVMEFDTVTRKTRHISNFARSEGHGFYRALYMYNGDYLLTGGDKRKNAYVYILDQDLNRAPTYIHELLWEGPALSRTQPLISWTDDHQNMWLARIQYDKHGVPSFVDKKLLFDNRTAIVEKDCNCRTIEPQNFRPPHEEEIIFSCYGYRGTETFGYHLKTKAFVNYTLTDSSREEPEGIFPDGEYILTECDRHVDRGMGHTDLYMLKLDGSGRAKRLTFFNNVPGYRATNPVVSDDGRFIAFQESTTGSQAGFGQGIYLMDLEKAGIYNGTKGFHFREPR